MSKKKYETGKIFTRIMAGILAILMVVGMGATLIYCLISM